MGPIEDNRNSRDNFDIAIFTKKHSSIERIYIQYKTGKEPHLGMSVCNVSCQTQRTRCFENSLLEPNATSYRKLDTHL